MESVKIKSHYFDYNTIILKLASFYEKMIENLKNSKSKITLKIFANDQDIHFKEFIKNSDEILLKSIEKVN